MSIVVFPSLPFLSAAKVLNLAKSKVEVIVSAILFGSHFANKTILSVITSVSKLNSSVNSPPVSLYHPRKVNPALSGSAGFVILLPDSIFVIGATSLPPLLLKVTVMTSAEASSHFAYNVISFVITPFTKSNSIVLASSTYQPKNKYPSFVELTLTAFWPCSTT